jgi:predicted enzyme involved in methoxymalonyl-ACP biosynthesis
MGYMKSAPSTKPETEHIDMAHLENATIEQLKKELRYYQRFAKHTLVSAYKTGAEISVSRLNAELDRRTLKVIQ